MGRPRRGTTRFDALLLLVLALVFHGAEALQVKVAQGLLTANIRSMRDSDDSMVVCTGIPYAVPPVGPLRFKDAQAAPPWEGERRCSKECSACVQPLNPAGGTFSKGSEDCLCVNVYAPYPLPTGAPVMVWIHGGAFVSGDGGDFLYGPDFLVAEGVVFVSFNYRLGSLGFLNLHSEDAPGNQGLKDQVLAIKWVKENIEAFGGNPYNMTLFGESAGSASVHYHTISLMSEGLFEAAIMESGSVLNNWAFKGEARGNVEQLLKTVGCDPALAAPDAAASAAACLRAAPARRLVAPQTDFKSQEDKEQNAQIAFPPSVDGLFLPREPCAQVAERSTASVPTMAGFNSAEGIISVALVRTKGGMQAHDEALTECRGLCQPCEPCPAAADVEARRRWGAAARSRFMDGRPISEESMQGFVDYSSYTMFTRGIIAAAQARANSSSRPHYVYEFDVDGSLNFGKAIFGGRDLNGSSHADEMGYLFNNKLFSSKLDNGSVEADTRQRLVKLWTNFAKTGNPTPETSDLLPVAWEPFTAEGEQYYYIGNAGVEMRRHPIKEDRDFFESLWKDLS